MVCTCLLHIVSGKMAEPRGLHLFVTYCCRQDGGTTWSVLVCYILFQARWRSHVVCIYLLHIVVGKMAAPPWSVFVCPILLQARWRRHVVCICMSHIVAGKMAAPHGLHLFVTYCFSQDGGATWSKSVCHIILQARWRHHVVCICLSHIVASKMPRKVVHMYGTATKRSITQRLCHLT
jgi:hypothetical protein